MPISRHVPNQEIEIVASSFHRNGVSGAPFDVVLFRYEGTRKLAILFEEHTHCAVLDVEELARGNIDNNRWRGDAFEPALRSQIKLRG